MEDTQHLAEKSLELLYIQDEKIKNIDCKNNEIKNNLDFSKYILDTFYTIIKPLKGSVFDFNGFLPSKRSPSNVSTIESDEIDNNNGLETDLSIVNGINKKINCLLENQNRLLSKTKDKLNENNSLIKEINSSSLF
jgi:hypothetical protein